MTKYDPVRMMLVAGGLILLGVVFPLLMVMHLVRSTFFLNFFSYAMQVSGFFIGLIGAMSYVKEKRK
jgi:hypothetical protein